MAPEIVDRSPDRLHILSVNLGCYSHSVAGVLGLCRCASDRFVPNGIAMWSSCQPLSTLGFLLSLIRFRSDLHAYRGATGFLVLLLHCYFKLP